MPIATATRSTPCRTVAVARAVRAAVNIPSARVSEAAATPAAGQRYAKPALAATVSAMPIPTAAVTPSAVGRRWVPTLSRHRPVLVLLHQRAQVEPGPPPDQHAHVPIVRPALVHGYGAHGPRPAESLGEEGQNAVGRGPVLAPETILRGSTREQQ